MGEMTVIEFAAKALGFAFFGGLAFCVACFFVALGIGLVRVGMRTKAGR